LLSSAELDRRNGDVQGVDEVGFQELPNGGNAAPAMFGPVKSTRPRLGGSRSVSLGMKVPWAMVVSITGWRPLRIASTRESSTTGRQ
jgi:hypothetical protein